ncbi:hypothetical protein BHE74_00027105 [Ensete ventricosum]|nr:hypothetical protein BHE74_00027105 [Ensete ventricosum]
MVLRGGEFQTCKGRTGVPSSLKAVCIHILSPKKFLILDSAGDLHVLSLNDSGTAMEPNARYSMISKLADLHHLDHVMEVQMLAALPDISSSMLISSMHLDYHSVCFIFYNLSFPQKHNLFGYQMGDIPYI